MASGDDLAGLPPDLLGAPVDLPVPTEPAVPTVRLDYVHFPVLMRPDRRMAAVAAVGLDGATLQDLTAVRSVPTCTSTTCRVARSTRVRRPHDRVALPVPDFGPLLHVGWAVVDRGGRLRQTARAARFPAPVGAPTTPARTQPTSTHSPQRAGRVVHRLVQALRCQLLGTVSGNA